MAQKNRRILLRGTMGIILLPLLLALILLSCDRETGFWIGFQGFSLSGGMSGGPTPQIGQWHNTNPNIWVNGQEIEPPEWKQPGLERRTPEFPFIDEDYFCLDPATVQLQKGWNEILLKVPHGGTSRKWMLTVYRLR